MTRASRLFRLRLRALRVESSVSKTISNCAVMANPTTAARQPMLTQELKQPLRVHRFSPQVRSSVASACLSHASIRGTDVRDEASKGQDNHSCEPDEAGSLLQPRIDDVASAPHCQQTREGRRDSRDQDEVAQDAECLWCARCRCHENQDKTEGDSGRRNDIERAGRDGVSGDPDQTGGREDADRTDGSGCIVRTRMPWSSRRPLFFRAKR